MADFDEEFDIGVGEINGCLCGVDDGVADMYGDVLAGVLVAAGSGYSKCKTGVCGEVWLDEFEGDTGNVFLGGCCGSCRAKGGDTKNRREKG